jgi:hypothetical protein
MNEVVFGKNAVKWGPLVQCCMCGETYHAEPRQILEWGNSGRDWDPTDWVCPDCIAGEQAADETAYLDAQRELEEMWR